MSQFSQAENVEKSKPQSHKESIETTDLNINEMWNGHLSVPGMVPQPVQMMVKEEEETKQKKVAQMHSELGKGTSVASTQNSSERSYGNSLPADITTKMESGFATSFADVKVHQDDSTASNLGALAYTQGNNIHFAPGQFSPNTSAGQELIGHELTHVVQQRKGRVKPDEKQQKGGFNINTDRGLENEADVLGKKAAEGVNVNVSGAGDGIQRREDPEPGNNEQGNNAQNENIPGQHYNAYDAINDSVGTNGVNRACDVKLIQYYLIQLGYLNDGEEVAATRLVPDNEIVAALPETINAIQLFQVHYREPDADGGMGPSGRTIRELRYRMYLLEEYNGHFYEKLTEEKQNSNSRITSDVDLNRDFVYSSQLDNMYPGLPASHMCNVTSLAMQIKQLALMKYQSEISIIQYHINEGLIPPEAYDNFLVSLNLKLNHIAIEIINDLGEEEFGAESESKDLEDLLIVIFERLGDDFGNEYFANEGIPIGNHEGIKITEALNHVGVMFNNYWNDEKDEDVTHNDPLLGLNDPSLGVLLTNGSTSTLLSFGLIGSGHFVNLVEVRTDGIIINDPYGMFIKDGNNINGDYLKNGLPYIKGAINDNRAVFDIRTKYNPDLKNTILELFSNDNGEARVLPHSMGEYIFFTWDEVREYNIVNRGAGLE